MDCFHKQLRKLEVNNHPVVKYNIQVVKITKLTNFLIHGGIYLVAKHFIMKIFCINLKNMS